jgi:hypothetical protein
MMLQNYELQYFIALADYHKSLASYEFSLGTNPFSEKDTVDSTDR